MSLDADDGPGEQERTMVVDTRQLKRPAPAAPAAPVGKTWKPHVFKLEKVSLGDTRLLEQVRWLKPKPEALEALGARLQALFDTQVGFALESARVLAPGELRRVLTEPTFLSFLVPGAHRGRAVLEVELALAHAAVDMLLGGAGETVGLRPLTDIEEGVASFVILEAVKALVPGMDAQLPKLRLEGVSRGVDEAVSRLSEDGAVVAIHLRVRLGAQDGMVRLFVPAGVMDVMTSAPSAEQQRATAQAQLASHAGRLSAVRTWLRAEIGRAEITGRDLASLRLKDVVLVDDLLARPDQGGSGTARLFVGLGRVGHLAADVFVQGNGYVARLTDVVRAEEGHEGSPPDALEEALAAIRAAQRQQGGEEYTNPERNNPLESDDRMDAGDLLGDIPLQISVELARLPVTAEQVVGLRAGQVVELRRGPGEPVDLSVNGKVVARGELVEIEGQLGVRILSLAG
ncbi:type III secretion system cytoplasmic ring protein SctQ [Archangium primigenium]|uniref:type III secretion system cytoplasmic ring protein SctQ n=1 Tax=[Archangium] primigenium TaxID=2792470 RepID=UPI00195DF1C1|nr:type III secretion system cytoplasmic ring protein SctQ [Archangium primigenium]MBM7118210.1 type III secretion system cytoplasmic ring protein SctQ [Archangium primigenium]